MRLNTIKPAEGSKKSKRRVGRGIGSGLGKTAGRGHKGQRSRSGGFHKVGFEGGQMPLQRRLPKMGFRSKVKPTRGEITLATLARIAAKNGGAVDLTALKVASAVPAGIEKVKVILSGTLTAAVIVRGLVAILLAMFSGKRSGEILSADANALFERLGLGEHLTPQRSNGFRSMVARIRADAQAARASRP